MGRGKWNGRAKASAGRHASPDGPPEGIVIFGALFTTWPPMWGHSSRCFAFGGGVPMYYLRPTWFRLHPNLTRSFFPRREKRSLIPSCGPSSCSPNCTSRRQFGHIEDLTGYWIGGLPVYQAGGPPLDFEKTGVSLCALRAGAGGTWHHHREKTLRTFIWSS